MVMTAMTREGKMIKHFPENSTLTFYDSTTRLDFTEAFCLFSFADTRLGFADFRSSLFSFSNDFSSSFLEANLSSPSSGFPSSLRQYFYKFSKSSIFPECNCFSRVERK
jgi:hypothetical protein